MRLGGKRCCLPQCRARSEHLRVSRTAVPSNETGRGGEDTAGAPLDSLRPSSAGEKHSLLESYSAVTASLRGAAASARSEDAGSRRRPSRRGRWIPGRRQPPSHLLLSPRPRPSRSRRRLRAGACSLVSLEGGGAATASVACRDGKPRKRGMAVAACRPPPATFPRAGRCAPPR